jgi:hypothetical protein
MSPVSRSAASLQDGCTSLDLAATRQDVALRGRELADLEPVTDVRETFQLTNALRVGKPIYSTARHTTARMLSRKGHNVVFH